MQWGFNPFLVIAVNGAFLLVDLIFFAANSMKVFEGGWFPLLLTACIAVRDADLAARAALFGKGRAPSCGRARPEFFDKVSEHPPARVAGTAAFLSSATRGVPLTLTHHLQHMYALHERVLLVTVLTTKSRACPEEERVNIHELACGLDPRDPAFRLHRRARRCRKACAMRTSMQSSAAGELSEVSYYIGRETIIPTEHIPGMWVWREALYAFMQRNAERSAAYFCIPVAQVVEIGIEIEI